MGALSIRDLAHRTAICTEDVVATLQSLNLIRYWKGQHVISVSAKVCVVGGWGRDGGEAAGRAPAFARPPTPAVWSPPPPDSLWPLSLFARARNASSSSSYSTRD